MTVLQRSAARMAALSLLLGFAYVLALPLANRLGGENGRIRLTDCQIVFHHSRDGLLDLLAGRGDGIALPVVSYYAPAVPSRPLAERLAAFGFPADPAKALNRPAHKLSALVKASKASQSTALTLRDMSEDADVLVQRYGYAEGFAYARAWLSVSMEDGGLVPKLELATSHLAVKKQYRDILDRMPAGEKGESCKPRASLELVYGALGDPWISSLLIDDGGPM